MDFATAIWFWWALALVLFALEALLPGTFMLWLGFAAVGTGIVRLLLPGLDLSVQWALFSILALVSVWLGWRYKRTHRDAGTDQPTLNRRGAQLVDRVFPLEQAIVDGRGRVKVGDALWLVEGPELAAGTRVRVVAVNGLLLRVVPAE